MRYNILMLIIFIVSGCQVNSSVNQNHLSDNHNMVQTSLNSVVAIVRSEPTGIIGPICTAFFISPRIIATANHCVKPPTSRLIEVMPGISVEVAIVKPEEEVGREILIVDFESHNKFIDDYDVNSMIAVRRTTVIKYNSIRDIALLELVPSELSSKYYFKISNTLPNIGSRVYEIGMPLTQFWLFTQGIVSSVRRFPDGHAEIIHQAHVDHGSSGSPIFNDNGEIIGITTAFIKNTNYIGYATTSLDLLDLLNNQ